MCLMCALTVVYVLYVLYVLYVSYICIDCLIYALTVLCFTEAWRDEKSASEKRSSRSAQKLTLVLNR